jgi:transposase InsO family protein
MPFQEVSKMQQRKQMVYRVLHEQCSVTQAACEAGVSRRTVYTWLERAQQHGLEHLAEVSRRPQHSPATIDASLVAAVLECKERFPAWGAKKIFSHLWPEAADAPMALRTVDRILARHGKTQPRTISAPPTVQRFERATCNELWQMDFKGMGKPRHNDAPLSILDDASRYCLRFEPLTNQTQDLVWQVLWQLFGEVGLPEAILTDNGSSFCGTWGIGPSLLETKLWLLGIRTTQGRPYHPQTQGKVERFHRTIAGELAARGVALRQEDCDTARAAYAPVLHSYNWERPHEALSMLVPGAIYVASTRVRPSTMPEHELPESAVKRKVSLDGLDGKVRYGGQEVRVGKGLRGQTVELREDEAPGTNEHPVATVFFAGVPVATFPPLRPQVNV